MKKSDGSDWNWGHSDLKLFPLKSMGFSILLCVAMAQMEQVDCYLALISILSICHRIHNLKSFWALTSDPLEKVCLTMSSLWEAKWGHLKRYYGHECMSMSNEKPTVTYCWMDCHWFLALLKVMEVTLISEKTSGSSTFIANRGIWAGPIWLHARTAPGTPFLWCSIQISLSCI